MTGNTTTHVAGKYRLIKLLGRGGMGAVYEAINEDTERHVALKVLHAEYAADASIFERFKLEARAGARINHPGVVEVLDFGVTQEGLAYLVMEKLHGEALSTVLKVARKLSVSLALPLFVDVLDALTAAHSQGIVHRDLKPANVFLTTGENPRVKLLDFGISKFSQAGGEITGTGVMLGTVTYMSPEQLRDSRSVTSAADIWAVGGMIFKTLSGHWAFSGESDSQLIARILTEEAPPLRHSVPEAPPELEQWVRTLLSKDPAARPTSVQAKQTLLEMCTRFECVERQQAVLSSLAMVPKSVATEPDLPRQRPGEHTTELPSPRPVNLADVPWNVIGTPQSLKPVQEVPTRIKPPGTPPVTSPRSVVPVVIGASVLIGGLIGAFALSRPEAPPPVVVEQPAKEVKVAPTPPPPKEIEAARAPLRVQVEPKNADVKIDGVPCANPCVVTEAIGSRHTIEASAAGFKTRTAEIVVGEWDEDELQLERIKKPTAEKKKTDGLEIDSTNPFPK